MQVYLLFFLLKDGIFLIIQRKSTGKTAMLERLQQILRERRDRGETNQEIAKTADITHQHINRLLNGQPELLAKVQFGTILKLFPGMIRLMDKDGQISQNNSPGAAASIGGNATITGESNLSDNRAKLKEILNANDICDSCKVKVLKILNP